jgi:hypothetical protein
MEIVARPAALMVRSASSTDIEMVLGGYATIGEPMGVRY